MPQGRQPLVWAIVGSQFAPPFMFSGVAVALPAMGRDLGAGATSLGLIETLFLAGSVAFLLPVGWLADASDKRTLYKLGLLCFGLSSVLLGLLSSVPWILALRFLQGMTSATFVATGPAILADLVPAEQRGRAYGASLGAIYAGLTLGPVIAGFLVQNWGWRSVFFGGAGLLLLVAAVVQWMMPSSWRRPGRSPQRSDTLGALARNRTLGHALLVQLLLYMTAYSSIFMLSIYLQVSLGHPARIAGQVLAVGSILMAVMAPVAGRLADRFRPQGITTCGVIAVGASALLATTLHERTGLGLVTAVLALQGLGFALFSSPNMTIIMNSVSASRLSMASALSAKARSLGMVSGMLLTAGLISIHIGNDPIDRHPMEFVGTMTTTFSILTALCLVALVVGLRGGGRAKAAAVLLMALATAPSCYTARVAAGGANLLMKRRPVDRVLAGDELSDEERGKLELTQELLAFADDELGLAGNGSYASFVRVDGDFVTWNVVAAPELSVQPRTWCFPVAGCVSYRGYFKEKRARKFAAKLERKGNDVRVGGVDAYSTLGRFKDPVLSTFLSRGDIDLARLLFHELAHQRLYVKGDTAFNESFATVVEIEGLHRWLLSEGRAEQIAELARDRELEQRFTELLMECRRRLDELYRGDLLDEEKRRRKPEVFEELRSEYRRAKRDWGGDARYDRWFGQALNNAHLASVASYHEYVEPLQRLLAAGDGSLEEFFVRAEEIASLDLEQRRQRLAH